MAIKENVLPLAQSSGSGTYIRTLSSGGESQRASFDIVKGAITADMDDAIEAEAEARESADTQLETELNSKVDKVTGKGLSTNDFTNALKTKLDGIEAGAEVNIIETVKVNGTALVPDANRAVNVPAPTVDSALSTTSTNPVQNKVITGAVSDLKEDIELLEEIILTDGTEFLTTFSWEKYGGAFNGATYSNGVLNIPSGETGRVSYLGINLLSAGNFSRLLNKIVHVKIEYSNIGSVVANPYIFTNSAYASNVKTIMAKFENNILDYWLTIDSAGMSYIFIGIRVDSTSPVQSNAISISVDNQSGYLMDYQTLVDDVKINNDNINTIIEKMPKESTSAVTPESTNNRLFMYSTGKVLSANNDDYKIKVYQVTKGNYYKFYSDGFSLSDETYVAIAFSLSSNAAVNSIPDEILFRPSTSPAVVDIDYYCQENGYLWIAQAPAQGEITVYNTELVDIGSDNILNYKGYKKILTIGDSLTNAVGGGNSTIRWQNILTSILKMEGHSRTGAIGLTVADTGSDSIYSAVQALTVEPDIDIISFWGGTNDWAGNVPLGDFNTEIVKATSDSTTFYGACIECIKKIVTLYPSKRVFCVGTTPRITDVAQGKNSNNTANAGGKYLLDYVDALKTVAEYFGLPFLDLYREGGINPINMPEYMYMQTSGGVNYYLHFSVNGEYEIGYRMAGFITKIG